MRFAPLPLSEAKGKILGHNIAGEDGERLIRKGKPLTEEDLAKLHALGRVSVYVAELEPDDVNENTAARRVAGALGGKGLYSSGGASGRVNLLADRMGIVRVDADRLSRLNECEGITVATLMNHSPVHARQIVATVKVIPYAVPESTVREAEAIAGGNQAIVRVDALESRSVGMILSGSASIHKKLLSDFFPLPERVERLGSHVDQTDFVALNDASDEEILVETLKQQIANGAGLILIAGETAIMDKHDIVPRAVERAGGVVESVGAPVDPGNLLMLAYLDHIPVVGVPGCARSRKTNIVDWILPRLLAGDTLTRRDIVELGHGGLLQDVHERVIPREVGQNGSGGEQEIETTTDGIPKRG